MGGSSVHCRIFSNISGIYLLYACGNACPDPGPVMTREYISRHCQIFPVGQYCPWLRNYFNKECFFKKNWSPDFEIHNLKSSLCCFISPASISWILIFRIEYQRPESRNHLECMEEIGGGKPRHRCLTWASLLEHGNLATILVRVWPELS